MTPKRTKQEPKAVRCAIYTRKSTEEGLELEFNSLDAQRDSAEAYIASQRTVGWVCLPDRYDDGGFTGGNMDRPALKRLMTDIEAGKVNCVVVYKVDRLSRSLMDFARMMEVFDKHNVSFVSVTQHFNTTHSMGRLTLNILLSFAQFEREIISERTRDKVAAARRNGKWAGGWPLLGYDIVSGSGGSKLMVNEPEAKRVREIFELLIDPKYGSVMPTVKELNARGWRNKQWRTKKGRVMGGKPFDKHTLYRMLSNVVYIGKVTHGDNVYAGEHEAIIPVELFQKAQSQIRRNRHSGGKHVRNKNNALLKGIVRCASCGVAMTHQFTVKRPGASRQCATLYRYYVCANAQKRGWSSCPSASVPAPALEDFVVEQIRDVGRTPDMFRQVLHAAQEQITNALIDLRGQHAIVTCRAEEINTEIRALAPKAGVGTAATDRLADLQQDLRDAEQEATQIGSEIIDMERRLVDDDKIAKALYAFDPVWESLSPTEQAGVVRMLVERVDYDGPNETVSVVFRSKGLKESLIPQEVAA